MRDREQLSGTWAHLFPIAGSKHEQTMNRPVITPFPTNPTQRSNRIETMSEEYLLLKWGTLKGWNLETEAARAAGQKYFDAGEQSMSAMAQHDTPEQKAALCELIDAIEGEIQNDWSGEKYTKEQAKAYVMEYGR